MSTAVWIVHTLLVLIHTAYSYTTEPYISCTLCTTTAPPTINGYAMHGPTEMSTPLPTTVHNIISEMKIGTEYTLLHTRSTTYTLQYNGCTTHGQNKTSTRFFTPCTGTHHKTCATLPQHQMRAYAKNRLLRQGRTGRALHTRTYTRERTVVNTCTRTSKSTQVHYYRRIARRPSSAHANVHTQTYNRYTCTRTSTSTHVHEVHRSQFELCTREHTYANVQ